MNEPLPIRDEPLYYGRWGAASHRGHDLYRRGGVSVRSEHYPFPLSMLDGGFLPPGEDQDEGRAYLTHAVDWTVLAFWDRSSDHRPGSHSTYVLPGELNFEQATALARESFQEMWTKYTFSVVLAATPDQKAEDIIQPGIQIRSQGCRVRYVGRGARCPCPPGQCWVTYARGRHDQKEPALTLPMWKTTL